MASTAAAPSGSAGPASPLPAAGRAGPRQAAGGVRAGGDGAAQVRRGQGAGCRARRGRRPRGAASSTGASCPAGGGQRVGQGGSVAAPMWPRSTRAGTPSANRLSSAFRRAPGARPRASRVRRRRAPGLRPRRAERDRPAPTRLAFPPRRQEPAPSASYHCCWARPPHRGADVPGALAGPRTYASVAAAATARCSPPPCDQLLEAGWRTRGAGQCRRGAGRCRCSATRGRACGAARTAALLLRERLGGGVPVLPGYASATRARGRRRARSSGAAARARGHGRVAVASCFTAPATSPRSAPPRRRGSPPPARRAHPALAELVLHHFDEAPRRGAPRRRPRARYPGRIGGMTLARPYGSVGVCTARTERPEVTSSGSRPYDLSDMSAGRPRPDRGPGRTAFQRDRARRCSTRPRCAASPARPRWSRPDPAHRHGTRGPAPAERVPGVRTGRPGAGRGPRLRRRPCRGRLSRARPGPSRRSGTTANTCSAEWGREPGAGASKATPGELRLLSAAGARALPDGGARTPAAAGAASPWARPHARGLDAATEYPGRAAVKPTEPGLGRSSASTRPPARLPWFRAKRATASASRRRSSWTGPTTWPTRCTTSTRGCTPGASIPRRAPRRVPERRDIFAVTAARYASDAAHDELARPHSTSCCCCSVDGTGS